MPSPFPGVDPYIEGQEWDDFHFRLISAIADALAPALRPRYFARVEKRVYLEYPEPGDHRYIRPDVSVGQSIGMIGTSRGSGAATLSPPYEVPQLMPEERQEPFIEIRLVEGHRVITVIELLSPANKRPRSDGQREYFRKRESVLYSNSHLVELDLLRGGDRVPMAAELPHLDFYTLVSRVDRRPLAAVWPFTLREPLPDVSIPLLDGEPPVQIKLAELFDRVYERAGYDYTLDYSRGTTPPLCGDDAEWAAALLKARQG